MKRLAQAWRRRPLITAGFLLASLFAILFAVRSVVFVIYWSNPSHRDRQLEGWMTARYIAKSWDVPPEVMVRALSADELPGRRQSLADIAATLSIPLPQLEARIITEITAYRMRQK
jgi:hypothetical protein